MTTLFWTVFFCLGLRIITDIGNLLYFIRKPFEGLKDLIENKKEVYRALPANKYQRGHLKWLQIKLLIITPLLLCITCMASVWGIAVFVLLNGFNNQLIAPMILNCFAASFIQTFIWNLYVRYIQ